MKRVIAAIAVASVVLMIVFFPGPAAREATAQSGTRSRSNAQSGSGTRSVQTQLPFDQKFFNYLRAAKYTNWAPVPGDTDDSYEGSSPHGAYLKMYLNRTAAGRPNELPHGSIIIKENYAEDGETLMAITVMYRSEGYNPSAGDWYWAKYNPDGSVAVSPPDKGSMQLSGRVKGCIACHGDGAADGDFVFFNDN